MGIGNATAPPPVPLLVDPPLCALLAHAPTTAAMENSARPIERRIQARVYHREG